MKKLVYIILITAFINNCKSKSPILPVEQWGEEQLDAYYKDLNNHLNDFEGTWLYTNGSTSLEIVLEKRLMQHNTVYYEDLIVGEYKYIENGIEKINTLENLNQNLGENHNIYGNFLHYSCNYLPVDDCVDGEIRLELAIVDPLVQSVSTLILHKRNINGQQALKAWYCWCAGAITVREGEEGPPEPTMGWQTENMVFMKQ